MKRRQFTISVATLAGLPTLFGPSAFAALDSMFQCGITSPLMARERFESRLGQQFTIRGSVVESKLRLKDVKSSIRGHEREQFHVLFDVPESQVLPEGLYDLEAGDKSEFWLHLLPGEPIAGRQQMVACINLQTAT